MSIIIGVTGTLGAGKDTIAEYLVQKHNFIHHSCSDVLRDELAALGEEESRDRLREVGVELRDEHGTGVLGQRILEKIEANSGKRAVVTSLRHPDEIKALGEAGNFHLISVDAKVEERFKRLRLRDRKGDSSSLDEFKAQEKAEMGQSGSGQQLGICMQMADYNVNNDGGFDDLYREVERVLEQLNIK